MKNAYNVGTERPVRKNANVGDPMEIGGATVLVIDDEESMRDSCHQVLTKEGYRVETAVDAESGLRKVRELSPDIVLVDLKMPRMSGTAVLKEITAIDPTIVAVVITGYATVESAVEAMKSGAYDFLPKPFTPDELRIVTKRGLEKRRMSAEMEALRKENEMMRENFVTVVTHEMRAPLVAVEQYLEVMLEEMAGNVTPKQKEILDHSRKRVDWLLTLVNEWLSMSRIQRGKIVESLKTVTLRELLEESAALVKPQADEKGIDIKVGVAEGIEHIEGDKDALSHVFMNLVSNAVKYNHDEGSVRVTAIDKGDGIAVEVEDTGIGIPEGSLPFIFDEFFRAKTDEGRCVPGTGLGLTIVKRIVEAHRGHVSVKSVVGQGSTFTVFLPKKQTRTEPGVVEKTARVSDA
jgi:two-component system sensor histidine kinase/response regulator